MTRRILYYVLFIVIVVAIIVGIAFGFSRNNSDDKTKTMPGSAIEKSKPSLSDSGKTDTSNGGSSDNSKQSTPKETTPTTSANGASNGSASSSAAAGASSQQLANSGPGDVAALFVMTTILGTAVFSRYQRKTV